MYRHGSLTALAFATMVGSSIVVSVLLAGAADPNLEGCSGVVPLHLVQTGDVTMLLLTHGADPNWQDVDGTTAAPTLQRKRLTQGLRSYRCWWRKGLT